ncbi:MAG: hypothetical protein ACI4IF_02160 [Acutalibacteraceae bacterium]
MNKKIIAALLVATILFICVFAACGKDDGKYVNPATGTKYEIVTDEYGKYVRDNEGNLVVYALDENGKKYKNDNGEYETAVQAFGSQIESGDEIVNYSYKITLPKGYSVVEDSVGSFVKDDGAVSVDINIMDKTYSDVYNSNKKAYDEIAAGKFGDDIKCTWEENVEINKDLTALFRMVLTASGDSKGTNVMVIFEDSYNIYKVLVACKDMSVEEAIEESNLILNSIEPYTFTIYSEYATEADGTLKNREDFLAVYKEDVD